VAKPFARASLLGLPRADDGVDIANRPGEAMKVTGGCHCGYITYEVEVDPANVKVSHCTD
jgi:hypothetical protein